VNFQLKMSGQEKQEREEAMFADAIAETPLRRVRLAAGIHQCALAKRAGVSVSRLSTYERGWQMPSLPTAKRLAGALDCAVGDLFDVEELRPY
jgi:transcriptional regulator with XRE-family HTH domain